MAPPVFKATKKTVMIAQFMGASSKSSSPAAPMPTSGPSVVMAYWRFGKNQAGAPAYAYSGRKANTGMLRENIQKNTPWMPSWMINMSTVNPSKLSIFQIVMVAEKFLISGRTNAVKPDKR